MQSLTKCSVTPGLGNSDHCRIFLSLNSSLPPQHMQWNKNRPIWRYANADFDLACNMLNDLDLETILFVENSIEQSWTKWKETFLSIIGRCIPKSNLPGRRTYQWLSMEIVNKVKKRNYYYRKRKRHGQPEDVKRYRSRTCETVLYQCYTKTKPNSLKNWTPVRANHSGRPLNSSTKSQAQFPA